MLPPIHRAPRASSARDCARSQWTGQVATREAETPISPCRERGGDGTAEMRSGVRLLAEREDVRFHAAFEEGDLDMFGR